MHPPAQNSQAGLHALGRQISQLGERLALSAPEHVEATIVEGLDGIVELVEGDRICWYEVDEEAGCVAAQIHGERRAGAAIAKGDSDGQNAVSRRVPWAA